MAEYNKIQPNKRITVTTKNEDTINSEELKSFIWRQKENYKHGQLLIMFQEYGAYMYDVPYEFFEEMAKRAYNEEKYNSTECKTPYEYYDSHMINTVDKDKKRAIV